MNIRVPSVIGSQFYIAITNNNYNNLDYFYLSYCSMYTCTKPLKTNAKINFHKLCLYYYFRRLNVIRLFSFFLHFSTFSLFSNGANSGILREIFRSFRTSTPCHLHTWASPKSIFSLHSLLICGSKTIGR